MNIEEDIQEETVEEPEEIISMEEMQEALTKIKIGKASGENQIDPEMIKYLREVGKEWLSEIPKKAWKTKTVPKDWENNIILHIYKKGAETECSNCRAICLPSIVFKIHIRIVEWRT